MGYLLKGVHAIVDGELNANLEAAQDGSIEDWAAYRHLCAWIADARYVLEAVAKAERKAGLGETGGGFRQ